MASHNLYVPNSGRLLALSPTVSLPTMVSVIRQSVLKDYHACRRLYLLRHCLGLSPRVPERSAAMDIGTFFHAIHSRMF